MSLHVGFMQSITHFRARLISNSFSHIQLMTSDGILLLPRCSDFSHVHDYLDDHTGQVTN